jgi:hypothetical protein
VSIVSKAWRVLREQGPGAVIKRAGVRLFGDDSITRSLVRYDDALTVDWSVPHPATVSRRAVGEGPLVTAWIMSPPGNNSGGHQNIFRFIKVLEDAGHEVRVYLYSTDTKYSAGEVRAMLTSSSSYPEVRATVEDLPVGGVPADVDAIFATGWETAYPSFRDPSLAARFYFVQDFEPYFYPVGSEYALAEATYRFGFSGITAGRWLATKLASEYGMTTSHFDFGSDAGTYRMTNTGPRSEVFFYARPATERRGFELGIMALDLVARARPDVTMNLVGEDLRHLDIPFRHRNLAGLQVSDLNEVYNRCAAGLVLSFTNMSLLPLELLGAGVVPVVNDGDNNRMVSDNPFIDYAPPSPRALADRLLSLLARPDAQAHAAAAAASVGSADWAASGRQFLDGVERVLRG